MIALINNKSMDEDKLTGAFFGNIRYISFQKAMKPILLNSVYPKEIRKEIEKVVTQEWAENVFFWKRVRNKGRDTELDVRFDLDTSVIGIEVKYYSLLSSQKEDKKIDSENSQNQLSRESKVLIKCVNKGENIGKTPILLLLAPELSCLKIYEESKDKIVEDVLFGYFSWEDCRRNISRLSHLNKYEKAIISDLEELLDYYQFESFDNFLLEGSKRIHLNKMWNYKGDSEDECR